MKKKLGIRFRVFLEVGAIFVVSLIALIVVNSQLLDNVYLWNEELSLKQMAQESEEHIGDYQSLLREFEVKNGVSIDLYDNNDNYVYEGSGRFVSGNKLIVVSRAENEDGSYFNILQEENSSTQYILYGKDFSNGYHIEITSQKDVIQENASIATRVTTLIAVVAMLLALIYISGYAKRFTKPIIKITETANKMSNLDFSQKCEINSKDEIGILADSINKLSASLDTALTELKTTNEQLVSDIEKERKLEKMRQDFVSSASHELKTPIAIIRGYAEGLKINVSEEDTAMQEYCDIIMNEADKMNSLVLSLLEASLYSSGMKTLNKEDFELNEFIKEYMKAAKPIFEEKEINAKFIDPETKLMVFADKSQIERVLSNYISNACSHTKNEKEIIVSVEDSGEKYKVSVYNSGSFIDDKDKDNIFNSFYRADKAHSRKEGRFGLGLSIVKSIMDMHKCECGFTNKENGVEFWFQIEKAKG
ncbi:MAG: HAMP domain-containing histidine kinase [Ruminococcaceae bacterium]|nr:HAMP domain-containing histidine kinase [Oscillospiraceae bacterium]